MNISDERKNEILEEEVFRENVKSSLKAQPKSIPEKIWYFANSTFGIWFFSAILLGSISFAYTNITEQNKKNSRIEMEITKYQREIATRTTRAHNYLRLRKIPEALKYLEGENTIHSDFFRTDVFMLIGELRDDLASDEDKFRYDDSYIIAMEMSTVGPKLFDADGQLNKQEFIKFRRLWCAFINDDIWGRYVPRSSRQDVCSD